MLQPFLTESSSDKGCVEGAFSLCAVECDCRGYFIKLLEEEI